jgi:Icc-related predicted phosphoesterase
VYFATDIHGSDQCFRKFLNAGAFYNVHHLILGGDMTGKALVPITRDASGLYSCAFGDRTFADLDESGLQELKALIRRRGQYFVVGARDEIHALQDAAYRDRVFREIVYESVANWVTLADERLRGTGRLCFVAPGNDDYLEIDRHLQGSEFVIFSEGQCLQLDEHHEMIITGYSNETPWKTERELTEEELLARIASMAKGVRDFTNLVAVLHAPPYASELDSAPELDDKMRVRVEGGVVRMVPVGSHAVRLFIEECQPLLGLHGHVHEARGTAYIGRTLCINPGSEYPDGILSGAIVELENGVIASHQLVAG